MSMQKQQQNHSSINTVFALVNNMIGGTMLALPLIFQTSGILTCGIIFIICALISVKTCAIYQYHLSEKQLDIQQNIKRILKQKWYLFFCVCSGLYGILLLNLYAILMNDEIYNILMFIGSKAGFAQNLAGKDSWTLDMFSQQWLAIIMLVPYFSLLMIKNLSFLIKMSAIGSLAILLYFIFILYSFGQNFAHIQLNDIKLFSWDVGNVAGISIGALTIHLVFGPVLKKNKNQKNNLRDLKIAYLIGTLFYLIVGICGYMAIQNKASCRNGAQTIIDCFPFQSWQPLVVVISYFISLVTVYPYFSEIIRKRILQIFRIYNITFKIRLIYNALFMALTFGFTFSVPYLKLSTILNINGSIFCFCFVYLIPIAMHLKCLNSKQQKIKYGEQSLLTEPQQIESNTCQHMKQEFSKTKQKSLIRLIYCIILLIIGAGTMIYGIYSSIRPVK